jgi:hypothetical protein
MDEIEKLKARIRELETMLAVAVATFRDIENLEMDGIIECEPNPPGAKREQRSA